MGELEAAFKVGLDQVVGVFYLPLGAGVACLVDHGLDLQAAQQAHEGTAYAGAAGVHHQMKGHAVHLLLGARLYGPQERLGHVHGAFATGHVVHKNGAAAVVCEHVAGEALALDLLEVLGLVLVEHAGGHVLQAALALAGHIKQGADGGVDLPDVVGVVAGELLHRGRGTQLVRVQRIGAQGAGAGAARELARLARIGAHHAGKQGVVGTNALQCQLECVDGLVIGAKALHELGGKLLRIGQGEAGGARIAAAFALGLHGDFL